MEKFKVSFTADNQQLKAIGTKHASDTYADIEATFVLGERWVDMDSVSAVWWNDFTRIATVLDPQGKCIVPHEVLTRKGCVRVNLVGSVMEGDELVTRLTSYSAEAVQVNEKIKLTGSETSEITPSQFEQFVAVVIAEVEKVTGMTAEAVTLPAGSDATAEYSNGVLHLGIPQGIQGETGNGIASVTFEDYALRFTFTDGTVFTTPSIRGAEGNGIRSIAKTGTSGLVDTYTITFDDGNTTTYTVTNGAKGDKGDTGATPSFSIGTVETLEPTEDATATITGTAENPVLNLGIPQGKTGEVTYEDLESILPRDTASGQIASFPDGQSVIPMHSLKVSLEPIQDLNGYDKPWAGGAGKNKYNASAQHISTGADATIDGETITATANNGALIITGKNVQSFPAGTYTCSATGANADAFFIWRYTVADNTETRVGMMDAPRTFTATEPFYLGVSIVSARWGETIIGKIQLETGLTATSWTPYSNICPISGHTEVVTQRTGVNVWDEEWEAGGINTDGSLATNSYRLRSKNYISIIPNTAYYFASDVSLGYSSWLIMCFYDGDKNFVSFLSPAVNRTFNTPSNARFMKFCTSDAWNGRTYEGGFSINYPSTDTDYQAYDGQTDTTSLGRTVYGGTLDVVNGELVVDRAMVDLGSLDWTYDSSSFPSWAFFYTTDIADVRKPTWNSLVCSNYPLTSSVYARTEDFVMNGTAYRGARPVNIRDSRYTDAISFKTAMDGVQLVYELATPQTIQLTPTEVRTLLGTNNVWSDGEVTVVYSADTALWIEKKLNA